MRTVCIFNHKGGVAKTTTAINLAAGLSRNDKKVLLVDLDPQGNVDLSLKAKANYNLYDALTGKVPLSQCIINVATNFDIITSTEALTKAEYYLSTQNNKLLLKDILGTLSGYNYMIIDCPPSLGILNQNAMAFCKEVFVPTSTDYLGFDALKKMHLIVDKINESYGNNIKITKIIPTLYDRRINICRETLSDMENEFTKLVTNPIRLNSKLKEAPKHGKSIFSYDKSSAGAKDYTLLVEDVMAMDKLKVAAIAK